MRKGCLLERHMHADVAGGGIDGPHEGDERDENEMLDGGKRNTGRHHEPGTADQQRAQLVARGNQPDCERKQRRAKQGRGRHHADLERRKAELREISRQEDGRESIPHSARRACREEQQDFRAPLHHWIGG